MFFYMQYITGNLIQLARDKHFDIIVHGCNCWCKMGMSLALQVRINYPTAYAADLATIPGDRSKLGTYSVGVTKDLTIINAYIQYYYSKTKSNIDYEALRRVFIAINNDYPDGRIGIPYIGAGLAGGEWVKISSIIDEVMAGRDITAVKYIV